MSLKIRASVEGERITLRYQPTAAEAPGEINVQTDWDEDDTASAAYLLNKPDIPTTLADLDGKVSDAQLPDDVAKDDEVASAIATAVGEIDIPTTFADLDGKVSDAQVPDDIARDADIPTTFADLSGKVGDAQLPDDIARDADIPTTFADLSGKVGDDQLPDDVAKDDGVTTAIADAVAGLINAGQADARIAALVEAAALLADATTRWTPAKLPTDTVYRGALDSALTPYRTADQIATLIATAVAAGLALNATWHDEWADNRAYPVGTLLRHGGAAYVSFQAVPSNADAEPGVGPDWMRYWWRLGWQAGNPDAVSGAALDGNKLEFSRVGGTNPIAVTLPNQSLGLELIGEATFETTTAVSFLAPTMGSIDLSGISADDFLAVTAEDNEAWKGMLFFSASKVETGVAAGGQPSNRQLSQATIRWLSGALTVGWGGFGRTDDDQLLMWVSSASVDARPLKVYRVARVDPQASQQAASGGVIAAAKWPLQQQAATQMTEAYSEDFIDLDGDAARFVFGGLAINSDGRVVIPLDGYYHIDSSIHFRDSTNSGSPRQTLFTRFRIQRAGAIIGQSLSRGSSYVRGTDLARDVIVEHTDWHRLQAGDVLIVDHAGTKTSDYRSYEVVGADSLLAVVGFGTATRTAQPYVSGFTVTGTFDPAPGDIGGTEYQYSLAIAHSDLVSAVRIVGFAGVTPGAAVTVLATIAGPDYHAASGMISLPSPLMLAEGEAYTLRAEVYGDGQTVGTDTPITHQDRRITAHAPAVAAYHWGRVVVNGNDANAAATAGRIAFATTDTTTGTVLADSYRVDVPDDGRSYQSYLLAKVGSTQPGTFWSAGFDLTTSWQAAVDVTIDGTQYKAYILRARFAATHAEDQGRRWEIRT